MHMNFVVGSMIVFLLGGTALGEGGARDSVGRELVNAYFRDELRVEKLEGGDKQAFIDEIRARLDGYRERGGVNPRRYLIPLIHLGDLDALRELIEENRAPSVRWRSTLPRVMPHPEGLVLLLDDFLFVDEQIDWSQYNNYSGRFVFSLAEIATEHLRRYIQVPSRRERFDREAHGFMLSISVMYRYERDGIEVPEYMTEIAREFWEENREHFLTEEYERVRAPAEAREAWERFVQEHRAERLRRERLEAETP